MKPHKLVNQILGENKLSEAVGFEELLKFVHSVTTAFLTHEEHDLNDIPASEVIEWGQDLLRRAGKPMATPEDTEAEDSFYSTDPSDPVDRPGNKSYNSVGDPREMG